MVSGARVRDKFEFTFFFLFLLFFVYFFLFFFFFFFFLLFKSFGVGGAITIILSCINRTRRMWTQGNSTTNSFTLCSSVVSKHVRTAV